MKGRSIAYSATEMAWLETNRAMVISDYHQAFRAEFGRDDVTAAQLHGLRKRKGWKVGRAPGRLAGRHSRYSAAEIAWLRENCAMEINALCTAFREAFAHDDATPAKLHSLRKRMGWKTGRSGHFEKGAAPWSKGKKLPFNPAVAATQFKKGLVPHNRRGPGHESIGDDGYVWIVTDQRNPWTGASTWRVHKHRYLWECANGPVPEGFVLKCLGNKHNTDPANWEAVPQGLLPRLNGKSGRHYDASPAELKPVIMAIAKLEHSRGGAEARYRQDRVRHHGQQCRYAGAGTPLWFRRRCCLHVDAARRGETPLSWKASAWAKEQRLGSPAAKSILLCLGDYAEPEKASCWPSQEQLASDAEVSERTARDWLQRLEDWGLIERQRRTGAKGARANDLIVLKLDRKVLDGAERMRGDSVEASTESIVLPAEKTIRRRSSRRSGAWSVSGRGRRACRRRMR
jgi:hypothetical protein